MMTLTKTLVSSTLLVALAFGPGCAEQEPSDDLFAPLETGDALEKSMAGPARYTAPWAQELFDASAEFYIYKSDDVVRGAVIFSTDELCQFQAVDIGGKTLRLQSDVCSGAIEGATLELSCTLKTGDLACAGTLSAPQGETGTGTMYASIVYAPEGPYEGPKAPIPGTDENGNCPGSQSPCGYDACCAPNERCGSGECWVPVDDDGETETETE